MTLTVLQISSIILALAAIIVCYFPRIPSVAAAWAALLLAHLSGVPYISGKVLLFWGIASAIVLMLNYLQPKALAQTRAGLPFIVTNTIVGAAVGCACAPVAAAIIIGAIIGAFLGAVIYMRLPKSPAMSIGSPEFIQYLCAKGLPAVVTCSQAAIVLVALL